MCGCVKEQVIRAVKEGRRKRPVKKASGRDEREDLNRKREHCN